MSQPASSQRLSNVRRSVIISLAVNGLVPLVLYTLLRQLSAGESSAIAIAMAVPAVRTIGLWLWRRTVDWIGILAVLGFVIALAVSALEGGSSLLLKIHGSLLTGTIGLVFLISWVIGKPLLLPVVQVYMSNDPELANDLEKLGSGPASWRNLRIITALIGFVLLADAAAHFVLAVNLPTDHFLIISRVVSWAILGTGAGFIWWIRRRIGGLEDRLAKETNPR